MTIPTPVAAGGTADAAAPFAVTAPANLELNGRTGKTTFTVTNLGGRPVKARVKPRGGAGAEDSWFAVTGPAEIPMAIGATATVEVALDLPRKATPGDHTLFLEVVAEDDTETVTGQSVSFTVKSAPPGKSPVLAIVVIVLVLLVLGAIAAWWFVLRQPAEPVATPAARSAQPAPPTSTKPKAVITNTEVPTVTGTLQVGEKVAASSYGTWTPADLIYLAQWQRCDGDSCTDIDGATKRKYTLTDDDLDQSVRVKITARGKGLMDVTVTTPKAGPVVATEPPDACKPEFTWRLVIAEDHVCVTPETRAQVVEDNQLRVIRWTNGPYGPQTCVNGYVWRVALPQDLVCVTPAVRSQTAQDNELAPTRLKNS